MRAGSRKISASVLIPTFTWTEYKGLKWVRTMHLGGAEGKCEVRTWVLLNCSKEKKKKRKFSHWLKADQREPCCFSWLCSSRDICQHQESVTLLPTALALQSLKARLLAPAMGPTDKGVSSTAEQRHQHQRNRSTAERKDSMMTLTLHL